MNERSPRWNVFLYVSAPESDERTVDPGTLDAFRKGFYEPATVSGGERSYGAGVVIEADQMQEAVARAHESLRAAAEGAGLPDWAVGRVELFSDVELDAMLSKLSRRRILVGVAELADRLGVSRQRVSQLAKEHRGFPRPEADLASGPVWDESAIEAFVQRWDRSPGRKSASAELRVEERNDEFVAYLESSLHRKLSRLGIIERALSQANLGADPDREAEAGRQARTKHRRPHPAGAG